MKCLFYTAETTSDKNYLSPRPLDRTTSTGSLTSKHSDQVTVL